MTNTHPFVIRVIGMTFVYSCYILNNNFGYSFSFSANALFSYSASGRMLPFPFCKMTS